MRKSYKKMVDIKDLFKDRFEEESEDKKERVKII
jgi:hypothetical protein